MGKGITIGCLNCSTKRIFLRGVGMEYCSLEKILPFVEPNRRKEVQRILETNGVSETDYEHRIFFVNVAASCCDFRITRVALGITYTYSSKLTNFSDFF